jgi:hypothetical protein
MRWPLARAAARRPHPARSGHASSALPASASPASLSRGDFILAALAALLVLGVYVATMYPGVHARGDAVKFAFVGKVLGTPHAPGYPLYMLVSHAFSYLPWGSLAYRMNLLSAVFGAATLVFAYPTVRRLGVSPLIAVSTTLALGLGSTFWSRALYAKGYTLNAALAAAGVLLLLRWSATRRLSHFYWAVGVFALSIGNHLIVVALLPALILFSIATDARTVLRPRTLATVAAMVLAGLSQYLYILIRTRQGAPYLEARAENLTQLWGVMTARRFAHEIGAFELAQLLEVRIPTIATLIGNELGWAGMALAIAGAALLAVRRRWELILFGLGALGVAGLTANMSSEEDEGFLLPAFVLLWPLAGVGLAWACSAVRRMARPMATPLTLAVAVLLPASQVAKNYDANDHHADTFEIEYFDALFAALPAKTAIVNDEYILNQMVLYKLLGERAGGNRDIRHIAIAKESVSRFHADGFEVLAFGHARHSLAAYGFHFVPFPIPASNPRLVARREIYRLSSVASCFDIGNQGWVDISAALAPSGRLGARIDNFHPFDSQLLVYAGLAHDRPPALVVESTNATPVLQTEVFARDADARRLLAVKAASDHARLPETVLAAPFVTRAQVRVNDQGASAVFALDFGPGVVAGTGAALVDRDEPKRATVCSHMLAAVDAWPAGEPRVALQLDGRDVQFGEGWYPVEQTPAGTKFRWTSDRAVAVIPLGHRPDATLRVAAEPLGYPNRPAGRIRLAINGHPLGDRVLPPRRTVISWPVAADQWREGLNEVVFEIGGAARPSDVGLSGDPRLLGASISRIELTAVDAEHQ